MTRSRAVLVPVLAALLVPVFAAAQDVDGFRGALLGELATLEQKYLGLAEAVPEEVYDWRPAEGIRSVGEVYTHMAGSTYFYAGMFAEGRPDDVGIPDAPRNLEQVTDKAQILTLLEHGFQHARDVITSTPESELDTEVEMFGQPSTVRAVMLNMVTHMHEHLGQSIAYARSNGVAPPWSR